MSPFQGLHVFLPFFPGAIAPGYTTKPLRGVLKSNTGDKYRSVKISVYQRSLNVCDLFWGWPILDLERRSSICYPSNALLVYFYSGSKTPVSEPNPKTVKFDGAYRGTKWPNRFFVDQKGHINHEQGSKNRTDDSFRVIDRFLGGVGKEALQHVYAQTIPGE